MKPGERIFCLMLERPREVSTEDFIWEQLNQIKEYPPPAGALIVICFTDIRPEHYEWMKLKASQQSILENCAWCEYKNDDGSSFYHFWLANDMDALLAVLEDYAKSVGQTRVETAFYDNMPVARSH